MNHMKSCNVHLTEQFNQCSVTIFLLKKGCLMNHCFFIRWFNYSLLMEILYKLFLEPCVLACMNKEKSCVCH